MVIKEAALVRRRKWYKRWEDLVELIEDEDATTVAIVRQVFGLIDGIKGFGSRTQADFSKESLDQVLKDKGFSL
jgi:hypothetical protein